MSDVSAYLLRQWNENLPGADPALWTDLWKRYSEKSRYYHNPDHLAAMFRLFDRYRGCLLDPGAVAVAIFFHDAVYKVTRKDNEAKSATLAAKKLSETGWPEDSIQLVRMHILATKRHKLTAGSHPDTACLLDFDLAILGASWEEYQVYARQIRREYGIYPDLLYRPGRRKALEHFLERPQIYHTEPFRQELESPARQNIAREIAGLVEE